jgi:hypothetical protein
MCTAAGSGSDKAVVRQLAVILLDREGQGFESPQLHTNRL